MPAKLTPSRILILDIDGLRQDVFHRQLKENRLPGLARLLCEKPVHLDPVSPAPSITFCAQTSIFTGRHPDQHGIPGNQFFDRFGRDGRQPRFYAFDIGDALAVDDAVEVFASPLGLLNETLSEQVQTLYEIAGQHAWTSLAAHHMLTRGVTTWLRPNLVDIARFTKGGRMAGLSAEEYDAKMLAAVLERLQASERPDILTAYFMGLDHESHCHGPGIQGQYLAEGIDKQVSDLVTALEQMRLLEDTLVVVVSDHGQIEVVPDDLHSLRMSYPFDREMADLFDALGLDVNDKPGEGPNSNAVVACNGGLAHVYLRRADGQWADAPRFLEDVQPVAQAFWQANQTGDYSMDVHHALAMVLGRDVEHQGWQASYQVYTPQGWLSIAETLAAQPEIQTVEAVSRLEHLAGAASGDLLLVSNYAGGYYFGAPTRGDHGGLHPDDSLAVLSFGWVGADADRLQRLRSLAGSVTARCRRKEKRTRNHLVDMLPVLTELMGWNE